MFIIVLLSTFNHLSLIRQDTSIFAPTHFGSLHEPLTGSHEFLVECACFQMPFSIPFLLGDATFSLQILTIFWCSIDDRDSHLKPLTLRVKPIAFITFHQLWEETFIISPSSGNAASRHVISLDIWLSDSSLVITWWSPVTVVISIGICIGIGFSATIGSDVDYIVEVPPINQISSQLSSGTPIREAVLDMSTTYQWVWSRFRL